MFHNSIRKVRTSVLALTVCLSFLSPVLLAQQQKAERGVQSIEKNSLDNTTKAVIFSDEANWQAGQEQEIFKTFLGVDGVNSRMELKNTTTTKMNVTTQRYTQFYKGIKVAHGDYTMVEKGGKVNYAMGNYYNVTHELSATPAISEGIAFGYALERVGAEKYMWQIPGMEEHIKFLYHRSDTSYLPHGNLVWIEDLSGAEGNRELHLAYSFDIYAQQPLSRQIVYVDATTGKILHTNSLLQHTAASNRSKYSQVVSFQTGHSGATYVMYDSTRGNGVYTMSANYHSTLSAPVDISSSTNFWPPTSSDTQAIDAHWGAEIVYDFWGTMGRASWDNANGQLLSYIHLTDPSGGGGYDNAYWDGAEMNYGDGTGLAAGGFTPLTSLDVAAHEIGHGVCQATANLDYNRESGAMNEGFSD